MIHELRIYRCVPGRLPALLKRFEAVTLKLWDKHNIRQVGFWTTVILAVPAIYGVTHYVLGGRMQESIASLGEPSALLDGSTLSADAVAAAAAMPTVTGSVSPGHTASVRS